MVPPPPISYKDIFLTVQVFASGGCLYDTPGLHLHHRVPHLLTPAGALPVGGRAWCLGQHAVIGYDMLQCDANSQELLVSVPASLCVLRNGRQSVPNPI